MRFAVHGVRFALVSCLLIPVLAIAIQAGPLGAGPAAADPPPPLITNLGFNLKDPRGIATGADGNLWIADYGLSAIMRRSSDGTLTRFALPDMTPTSIVAGPDGNLWFNNAQGPSIGRMTTAGVVTTFPTQAYVPVLAADPVGALWFPNGVGRIGRMTTAGVLTNFDLPGPLSAGGSMTVGADGNLWFTTTGLAGNVMGRIKPDGTTATFPLPGTGFPGSVAAGPNGALWFTNADQKAIGKLTTAGAATMYKTGFMGQVSLITAGADGKMWFANGESFSSLGSITMAGSINVSYSKVGQIPFPQGMTAGPDGNLWVTGNAALSRTSPAGVSTTLPGISWPLNITAGPDDALWFINYDRNSIGRVGGDGTISYFSDPGMAPKSLTAGPDGNLWYVNVNHSIGRMSPTGAVTTFPSAAHPPNKITAGPDGNLWFTYGQGFLSVKGVGRITPDGTITAFDNAGFNYAAAIVAGPEGKLWFGFEGGIASISTSGEYTTYPESAAVAITPSPVVGPDGSVWFFANKSPAIGSLARLAPDGHVTIVSGPASSTGLLALGPDGELWTTTARSSLARVTPSGVVTVMSDPTIDDVTSMAVGADGAMWFTNQGNNSIGRAATRPGPPSAVTATAGKHRATVTWATPAAGSAPIELMTVTASPGGVTCTWTSGPATCSLENLTPGVAYTFVVSASSAVGTGDASAASNTVTPWDGSAYHPLTPSRILDSRTSTGSWSSPLTAGTNRALQVTGLGGASEVPASASAVVMNVTATGATENSFVTAWPTGAPQPTSSNLNFATGQTIPNLVTVKLGTGGQVAFANAVGAVDLVADVVGYYDDGEGPGALFNGMAPQRLLDSRTDNGGWGGPLVAGVSRDLVVREPGRAGGVPATATAVVANVTVTEASADSFVSVWPSGEAQPGVSNLNFATGQTVPNLAVVKIGEAGAIRFTNAVGSTHVVVDVVGWFDSATGSRFHAINPTRVLDDRVGTGLSGPWGPGESKVLPVAGAAGSNVPAPATDLVANVTATGATAGTFVTAFPHGIARPNSSNLNLGAGQTTPNLVTVQVGTLGSVDLFNAAGSVDLIADVVGYYAAT